MPVEVFILTVVTDDAGNVILESRAPFDAPKTHPRNTQPVTDLAPMPGSAKSAYSSPLSAVMPPRPLAWADENDDEDDGLEGDDEYAPEGSAPNSLDLPAASARPNVPVFALIEDDSAVIEHFGSDSQVFRSQRVRPGSPTDGIEKVPGGRASRPDASQDKPQGKPVELTAAAARAQGMNVQPGSGNRIATAKRRSPAENFADNENAAA